MGRPVDEYYAEKMKKLLEDKKPTDDTPRIVAPSGRKNPDRQYYESVRESARKTRESVSEKAKEAEKEEKKKTADTATPRRPSPGQSEHDIKREEQKKEEAIENAKRARNRRKRREVALTVLLISVMVIAGVIVVYLLFFKVKDVTVEGDVSFYSPEEIIKAADIGEEHLFSFRESITERSVMLSCPLIDSVDVVRKIPSTVVLKITEQTPRFYCDFYGESYTLTSTLRVAEKAGDTEGKARLRLPPVKSVLVGETPEFKGLRNDRYIYEVTEALMESALADRITRLDLTEKFNIRTVVDKQYLIVFGESDEIKDKVEHAVQILADEMFRDNKNKYRIDCSEMDENSAVMDNNLELDN